MTGTFYSPTDRRLFRKLPSSTTLLLVKAGSSKTLPIRITTNLPFSEWTQVIPNARLCKALIDRITDRASIIETGTDSYRFRRTLEKRKGRNAELNNITAPLPLSGGGKKET